MALTVYVLNNRNRREPQEIAVEAKLESLERRQCTAQREMTAETVHRSLTELQFDSVALRANILIAMD